METNRHTKPGPEIWWNTSNTITWILSAARYTLFSIYSLNSTRVRRELLAKQKHVSVFDSENLMYGVISDVLKEDTSKYDGLLYIPLHMILCDLSKLESNREVQLIMNEHTHVDFLIFDKLSHQPV